MVSAPLPLLTESRKAYSIGISPARHMLIKNRFKKARPIVFFYRAFHTVSSFCALFVQKENRIIITKMIMDTAEDNP